MESFLAYLLLLLLLPLSLYVVSTGRRKGSGDLKNQPPGSMGRWPILGENREFFLDPVKFVKDRMQKHSAEIFQTSLFGNKMAVFCGAQGNKFMFTNDGKLFKTWFSPPLKNALQLEFTGTKMKEPVGHIRRHFSAPSNFVFNQQVMIPHDILKPDDLKKYILVMDALARQHLDRDWNPESVVKIFPWSKKYSFDVACKLFVGMDDPVRIKNLFDLYTAMTEQVYSLPINFPGTAYNRTAKSAKAMRREMMRIIEERRKEVVKEGEGQDLLSKMLMMKDEEGQGYGDKEICNHIVGLLVASGTTSSAITSVFNYLAQLPHIYHGVFQGNSNNHPIHIFADVFLKQERHD